MRWMILPLVVALCPVTNALAQSDQPDCVNPTSNVEMPQCASRRFQRADRKLNEIYRSALQTIPGSGGEPPFDSSTWETKLREAQRAWLAFRDADCKELTRIEFGGGSGTSLAIASCMAELTEARIRTLHDRYGHR